MFILAVFYVSSLPVLESPKRSYYLCPSLPGSGEVIGSGIRLLVFVYSRCLRLTIYARKEFVA